MLSPSSRLLQRVASVTWPVVRVLDAQAGLGAASSHTEQAVLLATCSTITGELVDR
jgi:hypothetical protein